VSTVRIPEAGQQARCAHISRQAMIKPLDDAADDADDLIGQDSAGRDGAETGDSPTL